MAWDAFAYADAVLADGNGLSASERLLLLAMSRYGETCWASYATLAQRTAMHRMTVYHIAKALTLKGWLVPHTAKKQKTVSYRLTVTVSPTLTVEPSPSALGLQTVSPTLTGVSPTLTTPSALRLLKEPIERTIKDPVKEPPLSPKGDARAKKPVEKKAPDPLHPQVQEVFAALQTARGYASPRPSAEYQDVRAMLKAGYSPSAIVECWRDKRADPWWAGKELFLATIRSQIGAWQAARNGQHPTGGQHGRPRPRKPGEHTLEEYERAAAEERAGRTSPPAR